jgi:hypothetical protein
MWADVLTKPLQGQKFRDMHAFLQNCPRSYDDDIELQTDKLVRKLLKPHVETVASSRECVGERTKNLREKGGQNKSPCSVSWADKTQDVSCEQTRQGPVNTSAQGIQNTGPHGQTTRAKDMQHHVDKKICSRYARLRMRETKCAQGKVHR